MVDHLKAVKLLDRAGKIPAQSWSKWFGPAFGRREARRDAGRIGGLASGKGRSSDASPSPNGRSSPAEPVRPSVPTVRPSVNPASPSPRAREEKNGQMTHEEDRRHALDDLSEKFKRREIDQLTYERERRVLAS